MDRFSTIDIEREEHLAIVTINRLNKLNALNTQVMTELLNGFQALVSPQQGRAPRVAVLTGAGDKAFISGIDVGELSDLAASDAKRFSELGRRVGDLLESAPFPVIAAVNGFALGGGCEFALMCDFIYASENARFGLPEVSLGIVPAFGGMRRLMGRVGVGKARELVYGGDIIDADDAKRIGLVNEVVPAAELMTRVRAIAAKIAGNGPMAIANAKRLMRLNINQDMQDTNEREAQAFGELFGTAEQREGMRAFVEKRRARFGEDER